MGLRLELHLERHRSWFAVERIFSGNFIGEAEVKDRAQAWVPTIMRFTDTDGFAPVGVESDETDSENGTDEIAEEAA